MSKGSAGSKSFAKGWPLAVLAASLLAGCSDAASPASPDGYAPPPSSALVESGQVVIRREVALVRGVALDDTPDALDAVRVVRYRVDPPRPARAIALLVPGFLGGAGSFDPLARAIVRSSTEAEAFEAWAIDRRSNLLEDHHGLDVAEVRGDPELGARYYFEGEEVEGRTFEGFVPQSQVPYAAEWGLATTVGDLRAVVSTVAPSERKARVFLVGHSLGASIAEAYASWDFEGARGFDELAGLALVDGVARVEGAASPQVTEEEYVSGGPPGPGGFGATGLEAIEGGTRYVALPLLGAKVYPTASVVAMRAAAAPDDVVVDGTRDGLLRTLLSIKDVPAMTNRAAMGFAFDDASNGLAFAAVSCGRAKGGAVAPYQSLFGGQLLHPTDAAATYGWEEFDAVEPAEHTDLDDLARSWHEGPALDFAEWYFPARLPLDMSAAATLVLAKGDWPLERYGLRAMHGRSMDLPIFAAVAGLVGDTSALDALASLVADVPIGPGRPLAGTPRTISDAFGVLDVTDLTHIDPLAGSPESPSVATFHEALVRFLRVNSPPGGTEVTLSPP